jgi:hypothetical protein
MRDYDVLIFSATAFYFSMAVAKHISLRRIISRLKEIDMALWVEMGSPKPTFFTKYSDYATFRPPNLAVVPSEYSELSLWLKQRTYERKKDDQISANAKRYKLLGNLQITVAVLVTCAYLYLRFVTHRTA